MHIKISLCGDVLITKRMPVPLYEGGNEISNFLKSHDCRFGNLETTVHRREGYPEAFPGGGYAMALPECLKDLKSFGFNLFNTANNHSMDYSHEGLVATLRYLDKEELLHAGTGRNLAEASEPVFFEHATGRVAMLGITSAFHDSYAAGPQNQDMQGRPGVAPLRHKATYYLGETDFENLSHIAHITGINNYVNQGIKEGYQLPAQNLRFGPYEFKSNGKGGNYLQTIPLETDLKRTIDLIEDAKMRAGLVIVSIHSHQFRENQKTLVPDFIRTFAHKCIDAGADIIACHGPHILRGIEIYNHGIIFHGLGNFIFQHESMSVLPEEFYQKYGTTRQSTTGIGEILNIRSNNGTRGLVVQQEAWETIIASLEITEEQIDTKIFPVEISRGYDGGYPKFASDSNILDKVLNLSKEFGTEMKMNHGKNCLELSLKRKSLLGT